MYKCTLMIFDSPLCECLDSDIKWDVKIEKDESATLMVWCADCSRRHTIPNWNIKIEIPNKKSSSNIPDNVIKFPKDEV